MEEVSEPVQVFVRIRPEIIDSKQQQNSQSKTSSCVKYLNETSLRLTPPDGVYGARKSVSAIDDKDYHFDKVFDDNASQDDIYESVAEHILATVRGYNTTIFAYGVTGSGKSYTMTGNKHAPGIIPRAIGDIFKHIEKAAIENDIYFFVRLSYVELYNNTFRNLLEHLKEPNVRDSKQNKSITSLYQDDENSLLNNSLLDETNHQEPGQSYARTTTSTLNKESQPVYNRNEKIEVRESASAGVFLSGPNLRFAVTSAVEAFQLIAKGNKQRVVASTNCNEVSSRSHAILTFHVESRLMSTDNSSSNSFVGNKAEMRIGKIHLVDLAGSERIGLSGAEGDTLTETKNINYSLSALGDVLSALSRNASLKGSSDTPTLIPVPYRNSKLTHLLKDSLGGNSKTIMVTTIRKASEYYQQTSISLMYAARAKKVRNKSSINRNVIGDSGIHAVSSEFDRLK